VDWVITMRWNSRSPCGGITDQDAWNTHKTHRGKAKRVDYLLRYSRDIAIAVVEAKADYQTPGAGLQQAKDYAEALGLKFAYSTNGKGIIEFDYLTGEERKLDAFPSPAELWARLQKPDAATAIGNHGFARCGYDDLPAARRARARLHAGSHRVRPVSRTAQNQ
jgi:type I site-specific restriction endonuclease